MKLQGDYANFKMGPIHFDQTNIFQVAMNKSKSKKKYIIEFVDNTDHRMVSLLNLHTTTNQEFSRNIGPIRMNLSCSFVAFFLKTNKTQYLKKFGI